MGSDNSGTGVFDLVGEEQCHQCCFLLLGILSCRGMESPSQPQGGRWFFSLHRVTDLCGFRSQASRSTDRGGGSRIGHAVSKEAQGSFCWSLLHSTGCVCAFWEGVF